MHSSGQVGRCTYRNPLSRASVRPPLRTQSAFGYSCSSLRNLLRASPRDPGGQLMARPKRPADVRLTERTEIRWTTVEKTILRHEAEKAALSVSEYVRRRALGVTIVPHTDDRVINELRRLGGLQKHLAVERPADQAAFDEIGKQIIEAIKRIV